MFFDIAGFFKRATSRFTTLGVSRDVAAYAAIHFGVAVHYNEHCDVSVCVEVIG